ncbi:hypothetical protein P8452_16708 [Trifolium repens]|nr:hypothetical protein P8452_16708 [Trifolium repens]
MLKRDVISLSSISLAKGESMPCKKITIHIETYVFKVKKAIFQLNKQHGFAVTHLFVTILPSSLANCHPLFSRGKWILQAGVIFFFAFLENSKFVPLNAEDPRYGPPISHGVTAVGI